MSKNTLLTFLFLVGICLVTVIYGPYVEGTFIRQWDLWNVGLVLVALPFLFLQKPAAIPDFWEPSVTNRQRFLVPVLIGIGFGLLDVLVVKIILHPEPYTELPPFLQPFPYSLFLYTAGALEVEIFYRLIPLTLIMLAGNKLRGGKYFEHFFWAGAILTALREPIDQLPSGALWLVVYAFAAGFAMNLLQAIYFRKAGFLATLTLRLGHYLIWHILLGLYVEYGELAG